MINENKVIVELFAEL